MVGRPGKHRVFGLAMAVVALVVVFLVEQILQPSYWIKTAWKAACFMGAIGLYVPLSKQGALETVRFRPLHKAKPLVLGMLLFFFGVMVLFLLLRGKLDLAGIRQSLVQKEQLTRQNCLFVFAYIILCNSLLEEIFFRGFLFQLFEKKMAGALVSAVFFALYHIGIFITWFDPALFLLSVAGLVAVGLFLQWIAERYRSTAASYLVHACANIAINAIGALLIFEMLS